MTAYYNEIDPYAAQWLRNLIEKGLIADGEVDSRSIVDVRPADLRGFTQCHFFAGIGIWSHALRLAGWSDDRPVWTGSCPCQPFSTAGKGNGAADERHLWPAWHHLIRECRPDIIFGEQVEAAVGHGWLDLVQYDLEGEGYTCGAVSLPACSVGAPHIRQRLWFVADSDDQRARPAGQHREGAGNAAGAGEADQLGHVHEIGLQGSAQGCMGAQGRQTEERPAGLSGRGAGGLADSCAERFHGQHSLLREGQKHLPEAARGGEIGRPSPTNGHWGAADWLGCRDGKWRAVEPSTFPLAHGATNRVGRLRAYGNAIVPQVAAEVIRAFMEVRP